MVRGLRDSGVQALTPEVVQGMLRHYNQMHPPEREAAELGEATSLPGKWRRTQVGPSRLYTI